MKTKSLLCNLSLLLVSAFTVLLTGCDDTPDLQQVSLIEVTNITANSAECRVTINLNNSSDITERGVIYDSKEWRQQEVIADTDAGDGTFTIQLENLLPGTIYGARGYAKNSEGVVYSALFAFKTPLKEGTMTDIDGNEYKTICIGRQEWMAENLKTSTYNNGTAIPNVTAAGAWQSNTLGAHCVYSNSAANKDIYGCLYNWYAVNRRASSGSEETLLAPEGWRVPSMNDWNTLMNHLISQQYAYGGVEENLIGKAMASTTLWNESAVEGAVGYELNSNNTALFNMVPSGYRTNRGTYSRRGERAYFWSTSQIGTNAAFVMLSYDNPALITDDTELNASGGYVRAGGFAVRCMRDVE